MTINILIAIDSYKDFASSKKIAGWLKEGILSGNSFLNVEIMPIGDGGEGTIDAIIYAKNGYKKYFSAHDPLFRNIKVQIGFYEKQNKIGIIEIARASGSAILLPEERNTMIASSYGTGDMIKADEAYRIGLADEVFPPEELMDKALAMAQTIASKSPLAIKMAKECVNRGLDMPLSNALDFEKINFGAICGSYDKTEGCTAFLEKRKAEFKGK